MRHELNRQDAEAIIRHPDIYPVVSDDGSPPAEAFRIPEGFIPLVWYANDTPVACVMMHWHNSICLEGHIQVLPEYREKYAQEIGQGTLDWIWKNTPAQKVMAVIPDLYPNVIRFVHQFGFRPNGINTRSILKDGQLHDQWIMGIERCQQQQQS